MIRYICKKCDGLSCESSTCPVCGERADIASTDIFYCPQCNTPLFEETCSICGGKGEKIGADVRPVFAQERLLIEVLLGRPMEFAGKSVWTSVSNIYWVNGKKIKIDQKELRKEDPEYVIQQLKKYEEDNSPYVENDFDNPYIKV